LRFFFRYFQYFFSTPARLCFIIFVTRRFIFTRKGFCDQRLFNLGMILLFYVLLLFFVIQGAILGYHWFKYGTSYHISLIALVTYLAGGAFLFLTLSIAMNAIL
jgi:hypothetical protein